MHISKLALQLCWAGSAFSAALSQRSSTSNNCHVELKSNPPSGSICGSKGTVKHPCVYKKTTGGSSDACRDLCYSQSRCKSFSYDSSHKKCSLSSETVSQQSFRPSPTCSTTWSDKCCYTRNCCSSGLTSCGGTCVDLLTDSLNCGACNTACPNDGACTQGSCPCTDDGVPEYSDYSPTDCGPCHKNCVTLYPDFPEIMCVESQDPSSGLYSYDCETGIRR